MLGEMDGLAECAEGSGFASLAARIFGNERIIFRNAQAPRRLATIELGQCRVTSVCASEHVVESQPQDRRSFDPDSLKVLIPLGDKVTLFGDGMRLTVGHGAACLYDPTSPHVVAADGACDLLLVQMPRSRILLSLLADKPFANSPKRDDFSLLLHSIKSEIQAAYGVGAEPGGSRESGLTSTITRLFAEKPSHHSLDMLRRRIEIYVCANLDRADLTVDRIAERMGCSPRYVHRAFETEQRTPANYIWQTRLERARDRLTSRDAASSTITDIAFSVGFSSSAHFSRAFRARYEVTPSELRRQMRALEN